MSARNEHLVVRSLISKRGTHQRGAGLRCFVDAKLPSAWVAVSVVAILGTCVISGFVVGQLQQAEIALVATSAVVVLGLALWRFGATGALILVVVGVALIPVLPGKTGTAAPASNALNIVRSLGLAGLTALALALRPKVPRSRLRGAALAAIVGLFAMASLGLAVVASTGGASVLSEASQAAGQPLVYGGLLLAFASALAYDPNARNRLLVAWSLAISVMAVVVAVQFATGAAYDPIRGISRARGTVGSDFVGAFAAIGVFGALTLRVSSGERWMRTLATIAVICGIGITLASVSRGATLALALGLLIFVLSSRASTAVGRHRLLTTTGVVMLLIIGGYFARDLYTARFAETGNSFDRPATWVVGLRIIRSYPLTGAGREQLATLAESTDSYTSTPYGEARSAPENAWLNATASYGLPYGVLLVLVTVALGVAVKRSRGDPRNSVLRIGLLAGLVPFIFNNIVFHPEIMVYILLAAAMTLIPSRQVAPAAVPTPLDTANAALALR